MFTSTIGIIVVDFYVTSTVRLSVLFCRIKTHELKVFKLSYNLT